MIYFVEDDVNIRKLVCYALAKEGHEIKEFPDSLTFWEEMGKSNPSLVLLDIMLPGEDGLAVLKKLKEDERYRDIPVIMLTAKDSEFDIVIGLDFGADDYIPKPFGMTELTARIRAVLRRYERTRGCSEYKVGELCVDGNKRVAKIRGEEISLSYKEFELLLRLLEAGGNVVSRDELLNRVWGEFYDESRTLDVHIRKLRVKLKDAGDVIHTVKNIGYRLGGNNE